ncbi:MAG: hypothetical protein V1746_00180 [bacterium]
MSKKLILLSLAILMVGCVTGNNRNGGQRVDPTIVSTSYDFTKPIDIAAQSKPVWILPVINKGWIPARVDPKTGDWISGHYQATIVQDGYWATQEEAELSGRPYIVAGESSPVVPTPMTEGPTQQAGGAAELDITTMQKRIDELEARQNALPQTGTSTDQMAALSVQMQQLAREVPAGYTTTAVPANQRLDGYSGNMQVEGSSYPAQNPAMASSQPNARSYSSSATPVPTQQGSTIVLPPMPAGTHYEIPSNPNMPNPLSVTYLEGNQVQLSYMGKQSRIQLDNPNDRVQVAIPRTVNLDGAR